MQVMHVLLMRPVSFFFFFFSRDGHTKEKKTTESVEKC